MRVIGLVLAIAVTAGAAIGLRQPDLAHSPLAVAEAALNQAPPETETALRIYKAALAGDPSNPYRWMDLGNGLMVAGDLPNARYCYDRALQLSGDIAPVWVQNTNFHIQAGESEEALHSAGRVLRTVPDFDAVLFGYFERLGIGVESIVGEIGADRRAMRSYLQHLIETGLLDQAAEVWKSVTSQGFADDHLVTSQVDAMLAGHRSAEAWRDWIAYLGPKKGDYPELNLLFNARFEQEPTGSAFDWRIQPSAEFETTLDPSAAHDGVRSLHIRFHGTSNASYENVIQKTYVTPGAYAFRAWVRADNLTTNEGPRIELFDPESPSRVASATDSFLGSVQWKLVSQTITVPPGESLLAVRVIRRASQKFDSKINGDFWVDSVRLVRDSTPVRTASWLNQAFPSSYDGFVLQPKRICCK